MTKTPKVSVIVPHYNDLERLDLCLASLAAQQYPAGDFEIIVADNASPVSAAALEAAVAGRARLTRVPEKGAGPARNGGAALALGEVLAFIDADCQAKPEWLQAGLAALAEHDFVGGGMEVLVDDPARLTGCEAFELVFAFNNRDYVLRKGFTVTANLFCARSLFEDVGGFRVGVSEDYDWCRRAADKGYRIGYAPAALVGHPARRTWPELERKWRRLNAETYGVFAERRNGRLIWLARTAILPFSALAHTPRVLAHRGIGSLGEKLAALGVLYRLRMLRFFDGFRLALSGA